MWGREGGISLIVLLSYIYQRVCFRLCLCVCAFLFEVSEAVILQNFLVCGCNVM